jgi:hypothetical protein
VCDGIAEPSNAHSLSLPSPDPTTGLDQHVLNVGSSRIVCKELGGVVMGLWPKYITPEVTGVVMFMDASNRVCVAEAIAVLYELLTLERSDAAVRLHHLHCAT